MEDCPALVAESHPNLGESAAPPLSAEPPPEEQPVEEATLEEPPDYPSVMRLTRGWVQYGIFGFAIFCIVISAVEALFGR